MPGEAEDVLVDLLFASSGLEREIVEGSRTVHARANRRGAPTPWAGQGSRSAVKTAWLAHDAESDVGLGFGHMYIPGTHSYCDWS